MSWWTRLLGIPDAPASTEQRSIDSVPWNTGGSMLTSTPTSDKALQLWAVFAAARLLASSIACMPLKVYRNLGDRSILLPSLPLLFAQPSAVGTLYDWLHRLMTSLVLDGNAYGLITSRDGFGFPTRVEWLNPRDVTVLDGMPSGEGSFVLPIYYWLGRGIPRDQIVHIPWFTLPGRVKGLTPLGAYATTISAGLSAQQYSKDWFDGGGVPPGTFKNTQQKVGKNEADEIKARLVSAIKTHQPIVYGADWEYNPIGIPPGDLQFIEANRLTATQIAAIYGIEPAERIGGATGHPMTYTNSEAAQINFNQATLLPYVVKLESVFFKLLPERQYVKLNMDSLVRVDLKTRHDVYKLDRDMGLKSVDELRQLEDMEPLPDGEGEDYTPLDVLVKKAAAPAPTPAKPTVAPVLSLPGNQGA